MHKLKNNKRFSKPQLVIFIIAFGLIGYLIVKSFAAPNPNLPGDLNGDNTVSITDLSILLSNYGTTNSTADINGDGTVSILDLSILLSHYGQSLTPASPDNTVVNGTNGQIVDTNGNIWTITSGGQVAVNGVADTTTSGVTTLAYESGKIWQENINNLWWYKVLPTDTWAPTGGTSVSPIPGASPPPSGLLYGYSAHILWQSDQATYVNLLVNGGAKTVRDDFNWAAIEPSLNTYDWSGPDSMVTQTANAGMNMLAMAGYGPGWATVSGSSGTKSAPTNNTYYSDFVKQVALRYGSNGSFWSSHPTVPKRPLAGIEIWNEPNLDGFWANPNPATYTAMLKAAYTAIKSADPNMQVISAGLAPVGGYNDGNCDGTADGGVNGSRLNGINFLQQMYQNGAAGYMDAVGYHPYNWGTGSSSTYFNYHVCSAWSQLNETPISVRSLMTQYGDGSKKVWSTEVGATTFSGYYTESDQGTLATNLMSKWKSYTWAGNLYWYDLRDGDATSNTASTEYNFGTVHHDNTPKPAYSALKTAWQ